jgi:hypothetical protein
MQAARLVLADGDTADPQLLRGNRSTYRID